MNILIGIKNFLEFVNTHWTEILVIIGLLIALCKKVKDYISKSDEEKIAIAKKQIEEIMLRLVTDAEVDYCEWVKAGAIKRSQVIEEIFVMYPILYKVTNQEELIAWIDDVIKKALKTMRDIFEKQVDDEEKFEDVTVVEAE